MKMARPLELLMLGAIVFVAGCKPQSVMDVLPKNAEDLKRGEVTRITEYGQMAAFIGENMYDEAAAYNLEALGHVVYSPDAKSRDGGETAAAIPGVTVDVLQIDTPLDAFGLFSQLREGKAQVDIGAMAITDKGKIIFWKGRFVVMVGPEEILGGLPATAPAAAVKKGKQVSAAAMSISVARAIADKIRNDRPKLEYFDWLPKENQVPNSLQYIRQDFMGRPAMEQVILADYGEGENKYQCFIFGFVSRLSAANVFDTLATGMTSNSSATDELETLQFTDPKYGQVTLVLAGRLIVGTTQNQKATALALASEYARKFRRQELEQDYYDAYMDAYPYTYYPYSTYYSSFYYSSFYCSPFYYRYHYYPYPYRYPYRCGPVYYGGRRHR